MGSSKQVSKNKRKSIRLAVIGDKEITRKEAKKLVISFLPKLSKVYRVKSVCTVKQDELGRAARLWVRKKNAETEKEIKLVTSSIRRYTKEKDSDKRNLYLENAVGALAFSADNWVIAWSGYKPRLSSIAIEQTMRLEHLGHRAKIIQT